MNTTMTQPTRPAQHLVLALNNHQCNLALNYSSQFIRRELVARYAATHTLVNLETTYDLVQTGLNTVYGHIRQGNVPIEQLEAAAMLAAREALALLVAIRAQQVDA